MSVEGTEYNEASYSDDVVEKHANMYHIFGTHYDVRMAFGTSKTQLVDEVVMGKFHTAIYMDYKLAKDMAAALQTLIEEYEKKYGPADVL